MKFARAELLRAALLLPALRPLPSNAGGNSAQLAARLDAPQLKSPGVAPVPSDTALPAWVAGRWQCTQTLESFRTPLGVQFIGAAGRPISEAEASAAQTRSQLGQPIQLELRFEAVPAGALEDRAFNTVSRLDAFAGRRVTRSAGPCVQAGGIGVAACTQVEFRGPVSQQVNVNSKRLELSEDGRSVVVSEFIRSIFARLRAPGDNRNFPPITTDQETIYQLERASASDAEPPSVLLGRLRIASFLQPLDPLYFEAAQRAVSISDYRLELRRLPADAGTEA